MNRAEANIEEAVDNPSVDAHTAANVKICEMYIQDDSKSVRAHTKDL